MKTFELSIAEAAELIAHKELSPVELVNGVIDRILEIDDDVGAFALLRFDEARKEAMRAEQELMTGKPISPLHGIPVALKDLIDIAGYPTSASSRVQEGHIARHDAHVTTRLREAGAIIIGKTHTHELAFGLTTPQTANPWNPDHTPGGSSGGSAAAVAYGGAIAALGTDTGGSIRVPAALCGVVGLKPTQDRISLDGIYPLAASLDHVGPITRTVLDADLMFQLLASAGKADTAVARQVKKDDLRGVKLGVPGNYFYDRLDPEIETVMQNLQASLADAGAELVEITIPATETIMPAQWGVMLPEAAFVHRENIRSMPGLYGDDVRVLLETGSLLPAQDYLAAKQAQARLRTVWSNIFYQVDALIVPTVPQVAARRDQETFDWPDGTSESVVEAYVRLNAVANLTGMPALTVPAGVHSSGLPFGVQFMGPHHCENLLLQLGRTAERRDLRSTRDPRSRSLVTS
ncbi:amidase [Nitratireductor basaltis]|uniref:Indoleacetamide hydrolase n=1 Tax=Nitratireductor basaltis TaxID=472175 RepID=A0A084U8M5_9HYPH|nr:amidase [Nitratireductor basaltis]KFB09311.1 Amidase [Nitratireductor basaltis]